MRTPGRYHATRLHPETAGLELALHHASGWPVLSIPGSPQTLEMTLTNRMPHPVATTAAAELRLQFRPGILTAIEQIALAAQSEAAWALSLLPADARGNLTWLLRVVQPFALQPGESAAIRIDGVSANAAGGSRATRVQIHYHGFQLEPDSTQVAGSRLLRLPVLRRHMPVGIAATALRGDSTARAGPFLAGLLDGPDLLNDGQSENRLWLRIVNASDRPIALSADDDAATRFALSFATGSAEAAWGLRGTVTDHVGLEVPSGAALTTAWSARGTAPGTAALIQPRDTPLQAAWQVDNHALHCVEPLTWRPGEWLDVVLTIFTSAWIGEAQLVIAFENLPPYDDGDLVLLVHAGPVAARPDAVTVTPPLRLRNGLDVAGDLRLEGTLRMGSSSLYATPERFRVGGELGWYYPVVFEDLAWSDGEFQIEISRTNTHDDQPRDSDVWRGSMILNITCHSDADGHGSSFWSLTLHQSQRRFVAGFANFPYAPLHVVWLAGDSSYRWRSNHPGRMVGAVQLGRPGTVEFGHGDRQASYSPRSAPPPEFDALRVSLSHNLIDGVDLDTAPIPRGAILMWSGNSSNVPFGWRLCNGEHGTPDLRGRFVVGTGSGRYRNDGKDGEAFDFPDPPKQPGADDPHRTGGLQRVTLAESEMPSHAHSVSMTWDISSLPQLAVGSAPTFLVAPSRATGKRTDTVRSDPTGGTASHENLPPYYVLCFIMRA